MKAGEFRKLTLEEMRQKERDLKEDIFLIRLRHAIKQPADSMKIKMMKRDLARLLTVIKEKEREVTSAAQQQAPSENAKA